MNSTCLYNKTYGSENEKKKKKDENKIKLDQSVPQCAVY